MRGRHRFALNLRHAGRLAEYPAEEDAIVEKDAHSGAVAAIVQNWQDSFSRD